MGDQTISPEMLFGVVVLFLLIGVLLIAIWAMHRQIKAWDLPEEEVAFSLDELRQMHKRGLLSEEEYHKARQRVIAESEAMMARRAAKVADADRPKAPLEKRLAGELDQVLKEVEPPKPPELPSDTTDGEAADENGDEGEGGEDGLVDFELDEDGETDAEPGKPQ